MVQISLNSLSLFIVLAKEYVFFELYQTCFCGIMFGMFGTQR